MKKSIFLVFILVATSVFSQAKQTMEHNEFDFWLGEWEAQWIEAGNVKATGQNTLTKTMNGHVIHEQFKILTGASAGFEGESWSIFDAASGQWKQTWVDNSGAYLDFVGDVENGSRIFERTAVRNGKKLSERMVFKDIKKDKFTWDWESSSDEGKTWTLNWEIFYTRKKQ